MRQSEPCGPGTFSQVPSNELDPDLYGWWRITETSQWGSDGLGDLGPAMISITGDADRLRMHCLLAYANVRPTKTGVSFTWEGAWEYDQMSGTGSVKLGNDAQAFRLGMDSELRSSGSVAHDAAALEPGRHCLDRRSLDGFTPLGR
jgi:hypothetical protein